MNTGSNMLSGASNIVGNIYSGTTYATNYVYDGTKNYIKNGGYCPTTFVANGSDERVYVKVETSEDDLISRFALPKVKVTEYINIGGNFGLQPTKNKPNAGK